MQFPTLFSNNFFSFKKYKFLHSGILYLYYVCQLDQVRMFFPLITLVLQWISLAMDIIVDPCEDFYRSSCGGWMDSNVFPYGKSRRGSFDDLTDQVDNDLKNN